MAVGPIRKDIRSVGAAMTKVGDGAWTSGFVEARRSFYQRPKSQKTEFLPGSTYRDPTNWSMSAFDGMTCPAGYMSYNHLGGTLVQRQGCINALPMINWSEATVPAWLIRQSELAATNKVRNGAVELGASFAERAQTAGMFRDSCKRIRDGFINFRKNRHRNSSQTLIEQVGGAYKGGKSWGQVMTEDWLAWRYGWKPIINDMYTAVKRINQKDNDLPNDRTLLLSRVTIPHNEQFSRLHGSANGVNHFYLLKDEMKCQVGFLYDIDPSQDFFRALDEWGVLNPASVAWEVLPYSHVIDWALPVGDYISALTATIGYHFVAGWRTEFTTRNCSNWYTPYPDHVARNMRVTAGANWQAKGMKRTKYTSFPRPELRSVLDLKNLPDAETITNRVAEGMAMLVQAFVPFSSLARASRAQKRADSRKESNRNKRERRNL